MRVSIIMGIYNCEDTLKEAVESIFCQTYDDWELIMRLAATLNRCLRYASGEYIARMDADDICLPERLQKQVNFLDNHLDYACVGCNLAVFDENGDYGIRLFPQETKASTLLKTTIFAHPTIMMRSSVYKKLGGYTVSDRTMRAEDLDLWFRFINAGYKGYNLQEILYRYRESKKDLKKRSLNAAIKTSKVFIYGYKLLGFSRLKYIYAFRPVIVAMIPKKLICLHHKGTKLID